MIVLHPRTKKDIEQFVARPSHSLLVAGPSGVGKDTVALEIATKLLGQLHQYKRIDPSEKRSITIEQIREMNAFLKLKTAGSDEIRRIVHVSDADLMTVEAQNALLKTLEEPPADTLLVLTSSHPERLLLTIRSRTAKLTIQRPQASDVQKAFPSVSSQNLALATGLPGLVHALAENEDHPLVDAIDVAKKLISGDQFERLAQLELLNKSDVSLDKLVWAIERVSQAGQHAAIAKNDANQVKRWQRQREVALEVLQDLEHNPNKKLLLTDLALHM